MEIINKLSQKEKNLIFLLAIMIILIVSYHFGFVRLNDKTDALYSENIELNTKLADLQEKAANKKSYIEETEQMTEEIDTMLTHLASSMNQEKSTMYITELEEYAKMNVSAITFGDITEVYSSSKAANSEEGGSETEENGTQAEQSEDASKEQAKYKGYKSNITINYQTNYAGLKSAIDHINQYKEKMRIQSLTAAFDNTTGNLTGTISIDIFALIGEGRTAEPVDIYGVNIGSDNIFGTFELPVE
ncbi:MAG: hypothetical protein GX915_04215 [Clostridiales bacterium]|nr:hypothetical protein [Clostridiales bacterium]